VIRALVAWALRRRVIVLALLVVQRLSATNLTARLEKLLVSTNYTVFVGLDDKKYSFTKEERDLIAQRGKKYFTELEKELVKLYAPQLVTKEVTVALESSAFLVYVTGAVTRPGKMVSDRPLTALEAVLDAGVDYQKANLKSVTVIRHENGRDELHALNLKKALEGKGGEPFYLKPQDIIFVRERFTWF